MLRPVIGGRKGHCWMLWCDDIFDNCVVDVMKGKCDLMIAHSNIGDRKGSRVAKREKGSMILVWPLHPVVRGRKCKNGGWQVSKIASEVSHSHCQHHCYSPGQTSYCYILLPPWGSSSAIWSLSSEGLLTTEHSIFIGQKPPEEVIVAWLITKCG